MAEKSLGTARPEEAGMDQQQPGCTQLPFSDALLHKVTGVRSPAPQRAEVGFPALRLSGG